MDIRTTGGPATAEEMAAVDGLVGEPEPVDHRVSHGGRAVRSQRHLLLPVLHAIQDRTGWVSRGALEYACRRLSIPPAEAYGVVSFYARFALEEPHDSVTRHVCDDISCILAGAKPVEGGRPSPCLGLCDRAPAALVERFGADYEATQMPESSQPTVTASRLLRRVGVVDPESIDSYRENGGFNALRRAREIGPEGVIREVTGAGLLGRGGAAFPTGRKWESVATAPAPRYLVCNADESEPGTFKDRVLMESDPFAVIEAMSIAAFVTGCEKGFIYIRAEYPLARKRIQNAIVQAQGVIGIEIEVRRGAGAYICGEETALFNSIEGKRGEPRNKPPFPVEVGLFGRPTLVNNVETLVNVLAVINGDFADTRIFCVSGHVERPGLYELAMGTPLRTLLDMAGVHNLQAVLLGGAAGSFLTADQIDVPLSFEGTRAIGATLGSGAVIVFDDTADMKQVLLRIARFFRDESCGQCVPCRVGTKRQEEILERMLHEHDGDRRADVMLLSDIAQAMRDASICGLGQTAANAIASGLTQLKVLNA